MRIEIVIYLPNDVLYETNLLKTQNALEIGENNVNLKGQIKMKNSNDLEIVSISYLRTIWK